MKLERLDFRELATGEKIANAAVLGKVFMPSRVKKEEPPPPPPPPTFSEDQMLEAEREGYKKGFMAGELEGQRKSESEQAEVNIKLVAMVDQFAQSVAPVFENYRQMVMQLQADLPKVALAIAQKVAGVALHENAAAIVSDLAMRSVESMITEPELTIVAHESLADTLENKLQELAKRLPAATQIIIVRDPDMPLSDCRIEWNNGSLARVTTQLWQNVEKAVSNMQIIVGREATDKMQALQVQVLTNQPTPSSEKE
jgi:flagellar assembly protein FliH